MAYQLLTEYETECGCSPDTDLCWKVFGARPIGSSGPFTFPVNLEINGSDVSITNPSQILPGGSNPNITNWNSGPLEYAFIYTSACPSDGGCGDSALFLVEASNCCTGSVTISETDCDFSSATSGITTPVYQWQEQIGTTWVNIPGETGSTYTGEDGDTVRLIVTDNADGCEYISNILTGDCAPEPCSISCNVSLNANGDIQVTYNIQNVLNPQYQINPWTGGDCFAGGVGFPICSGALSNGVSSFTCTPPELPTDQCYRVILFGSGCICQDQITVPASAGSCEVQIQSTAAGCTAEITGVYDQAESAVGTATLAPFQSNTVWQELRWWRRYEICGGGSIFEEDPNSFGISGANQNSSQSYRPGYGFDIGGSDGGANGVNGDYVAWIELSNNLGGSAQIDLNPATTPYLSGNYGTVDPADLYFTLGMSSSVLTGAYETLIKNAIFSVFGATPKNSATDTAPGDYFLQLQANTTSNNVRWLELSWIIKHNAVGLWVGPASGQQAQTANANSNTNTVNAGRGSGFAASFVSSSIDSPCGNVFVRNYSFSPQTVSIGGINFAGSDYVTLALGSANIDNSTELGNTNSPQTCTGITLSVNVIQGNGAPQYLWSTGETTPTISVNSGTYSVTVTFSDGCQATDTITV